MGGWVVARNRRDRSGAVLTIRMPVVPEVRVERRAAALLPSTAASPER
jgi:hypothetical protein